MKRKHKHQLEERLAEIQEAILEEEGHLMQEELVDRRQIASAIKRELEILYYQLNILQHRHAARLRPFLLLLGGLLGLLLQGYMPY